MLPLPSLSGAKSETSPPLFSRLELELLLTADSINENLVVFAIQWVMVLLNACHFGL